MASPNQILGKAVITVNGQRIASKPGAELTPGYGEREAAMGENGPEGFTEKAGVWMLKAEWYAKAGITASKLWNLVDATIVFEGDNGYRCTLVQATTMKVGPLKTGDQGSFEVELFGMRGNEE
ncbi:MAG: phage tail tube protein [Reyranella sp.]|jgi:hypothetical protein|nr:phage tail tube protein [Reyranella sp.]